MPMTLTWLLTAMFACRSGNIKDEGISVGNPGETALRLGPGNGLTHRDARVDVQSLTVTSCDEASSIAVHIDTQIDLLTDPAVALPEGEWCRLDLTPGGPLMVSGDGAEGTYQLSLALGDVTVSTKMGTPLGDGPMVMEFGSPGWLSADELDVTGGALVQIDSEHPLFQVLSERWGWPIG